MLVVNEVFTSLQGEGLLIGQPTTFIRFGGCNLRCVWCDTKYAVDPVAYGKLGEPFTVDLFMDRYKDLCSKTTAICFTGGDPMVQPRNEFLDLITRLNAMGKVTTLETAATLYDEDICKELAWVTLSPKLPSAEVGSMNYDVINDYLATCTDKLQFKFVVQHDEDEQELMKFTEGYYDILKKRNIPIVIQAVDGYIDILKKLSSLGTNTNLNVRFLPRLHSLLNMR